MKYIHLSGEVSSWNQPGCISANQTRQLIADARAENRAEPITVVLNSFGGDVTEGVAVYNLLRASHPVDIVISGIAASIASVIAMAGDRVAMYSNSTLYIHHAYSFTEGNASQMKQRIAELESADRVLIDAYMAKSGRSEEEIVALLDGPNGEGSSINADRALELGLVDEVLDPATAVAALLKNRIPPTQHTNRASAKPGANKEPAMSAEPETTVQPAAECGGTPQKNEEVVEIEKEVKETSGGDDAQTRIEELEKKVEELSSALKARDEKLAAQAKFRAVTAFAASTTAEASLDWPQLVKQLGFKAAAEKYPEVRKAYMKAQIAKGSIR